LPMATLYLSIVRRSAAAAFAGFDGSVVLGLASLILAALWGPVYLVPAVLFLLPVPGAIWKAALRRNAFFSAAPAVASAWKVSAWQSAMASTAASRVMAAGLVGTRTPTAV